MALVKKRRRLSRPSKQGRRCRARLCWPRAGMPCGTSASRTTGQTNCVTVFARKILVNCSTGHKAFLSQFVTMHTHPSPCNSVRPLRWLGILAASLGLPLLLPPAGLAATQSATFNPVLRVDASSSSTGFTFTGFTGSVTSVLATINLTKCDDPINNVTGQCIGSGFSYNREIILSLQSPSGTVVPLVKSSTLVGQQPGDTVTWTFDDNASSILSGDVLVSGTYLPSSPLKAFRGEEGNGLWQLLFEDNAGSDPMSINSWSLTVNTVPGPLPVLGAATALGYSRRIRRRLAVSDAKG